MRGPRPTHDSLTQGSCAEKYVPTTSGSENQQELNAFLLVRQKMTGSLDVFLKGLSIDSLACKKSPWALAKGQQPERCKRHTEKLLCGFRARARGTATIIIVWSLTHVYPTGKCHLSCIELTRKRPNLRTIGLVKVMHAPITMVTLLDLVLSR